GLQDDLGAALQVEGELRRPGTGGLARVGLEHVDTERIDAEQHCRDDEQAEEDPRGVASRGCGCHEVPLSAREDAERQLSWLRSRRAWVSSGVSTWIDSMPSAGASATTASSSSSSTS